MIRYDYILAAIEYYRRFGFEYIEAPWVVDREAIESTLPPGREVYQLEEGEYLVASAEQSFVHLGLTGQLAPGWYMAATPCFRDDVLDALHHRYFFKLELIVLGSAGWTDNGLSAFLANLALEFFQTLPGGEAAEIVETAEGYDVQLNGIELGSYGCRLYKDLCWVYGTGIAEPRFSTVAGVPPLKSA